MRTTLLFCMEFNRLAQFEGELPQLMKVKKHVLEIALLKMKINEKKNQDIATKWQRKMKTDEVQALDSSAV